MRVHWEHLVEVWQAITYVSSPLTLVAFLAAVVAWVYITQLKRIENLIGSAEEGDRRVLLEGVLDVLRVPTDDLPAARRYELALQLLQARSLKLKLAFVAFLVVAVGLLVLSAVAIYQRPTEKSVSDLLEGSQKEEAIAALKKHKIFPLADSDLPTALSKLVELEKQEDSLGAVERTERLRAKIDQNPSVSELRRRAEQTQPPFQRLGQKMQAGIPKIGPDQPARFFVNVPISADYAWKRVAVLNPKTGTLLRLIAKPAIDDQLRDVDLHLNYLQAEQLVGSQLPARTVELWIQVLEPGPLYDPSCEPARKPTGKKRQAACDPDEAPESSAVLKFKA